MTNPSPSDSLTVEIHRHLDRARWIYGWRIEWPNGGKVLGAAESYPDAVKRVSGELAQAAPTAFTREGQ